MKNKKLLSLVIIGALATTSIASGITAFAATNTKNTQSERPAKPDNVVIGKITAISANSITITLADMKAPENNGQNNNQNNDNHGFGNGERPANFTNNGQGFDGSNPPEPPKGDANRATPPELGKRNKPEKLSDEQLADMKKNIENMFTLTGTIKTYDISNAKFDEFMKRSENNGTGNNNTETKVTKTYKDYSVSDYVMVELENSSSTTAKSVRNAMMMGHGGMGKGGMPPKDNNNTTNQ